MRCTSCNGMGKIMGLGQQLKKCPACDGKGNIDTPKIEEPIAKADLQIETKKEEVKQFVPPREKLKDKKK